MVVAKDSNGKPYRFVATNTDIDERKRIEEKLTLYTRYLEQMNADLKQLAYITTHDLKEPIRNITGFIQLLKRRNEDQLDDTSKEYISNAIEGCHRLVNIIEDLLDYSRIELGENSMEEVNMADVWLEVLENLDPVIREKKVSIQSVGLPTIMANKGHMSRLLQNLLSNAIKYNNHPHPEVTLSYSADPQYHVFSVKDNGIGIDSKYYAHIYKMFKRLHGMDEYEGIGMGLAICKRIIETHKGALWHESTPGMGTTFHFTIGKS
jgi:light-regulated signal transduction histidine kinase (bacteriophytochrome)